MKMADVVTGKVYVKGYNQGRNGITPTSQRVMVDATYVSQIRPGSSGSCCRFTTFHWTKGNEAEWKYTGQTDEEGNHVALPLAGRELITGWKR